MKLRQIIALALIGLLLFSTVYISCSSDPKTSVQPVVPPKPTKVEITAPDFDASSAFNFVKTQVEFGPRVPGTATHLACADWLETTMKNFGATVQVQKAGLLDREGKNIQIRNIIAQFQPEKKDRVLLFAHWDTRPIADKDKNAALKNKPIDGANDGGSGVGVLLEIARQLQLKPTTVGVDIIFFDAEDNGMPEGANDDDEILNDDFISSWCLGSQYFARNMHVINYNPRFGICLDMVGAGDATFYKEGTSLRTAPDVVNLVWNTAGKMGFGNYFINDEVEGVIDDHYFLNAKGLRCIDIIDTRPMPSAMGLNNYLFGSYHHTHNDNLKLIEPNTLKAVGQTVMQVIYNQ
jgi:glutaminyl-peptide cyclotransferase